MKLALIIDDYLPDSTRVGAKMFHELAVELVYRGHQVTVITPCINHNEDLHCDSLDGVNIWHFKSGPIKDVSKLQRAINETMLSIRAWRAIKSKVHKDTFDGIVYYSPSIFWGRLVFNLKKRCRCSAYLVLRDLFPQWVVDAGILKKGSALERYFRYFERYSYRQADKIGLMSEGNLNIFRSFDNKFPSEVLRNWASIKPFTQASEKLVSFRERLNLTDKVIFLYGGNIGHAQDMANLMRLVKGMLNYKQAHFLFVGQGDEVDLVNELSSSWNLTNFTLLPSVSQSEFKQLLTEVDVGLFSLSANHTSHNFPGKLLGYMVESLPILGSVNAGNDLLETINRNNAGYVYINGEDDKLLEAAEHLLFQQELRSEIGQCSHKLLIEQFSVTAAASTIEIGLEANNAFD